MHKTILTGLVAVMAVAVVAATIVVRVTMTAAKS